MSEFRGLWIPAEVHFLQGVSLIEKHVLSQIIALSIDGNCYASNEYFAKLFELSKGRISHILGSLVEKGFIIIPPFAKNSISREIIFNAEMLHIASPSATDSISQMLHIAKRNATYSTFLYKDESKVESKVLKQSINLNTGDLEKIKETAERLIEEKILPLQFEEKKEKILGEKKKEVELIYPFPEHAGFMQAWEEWLSYRRGRRISASRETYQQNALINLDQLSGHNPELAIEIIKRSILQHWEGLFEIKNKNTQNGKPKYSIDKFNAALDRLNL